MQRSATQKILLIADGDSRIAWVQRLGAMLGLALYENDACCTLLEKSAQTASETLFEKKTLDITAFDLVLMGFGGGANLKFSNAFSDYFSKTTDARRPLLLAGFNGICDAEDPHALYCRTGADIIFANCANDLEKFNTWLQYGGVAHAKKLEILGYVTHNKALADNSKPGSVKPPSLLFIGQPGVPRSLKERRYVLHALNTIAERHPDWRIIIKPRAPLFHRNITHVEKFHYQEISRVFMGRLPANVRFSHDPIHQLLDSTTLCVTLGSTIAIEAIGKGIATLVMSDFGIRRDYGNHHFVGSHCLAPLMGLNLDQPFAPVNPDWQKKYLAFADENIFRIAQRLKTLLREQEKHGQALPLPTALYDTATHPYMATGHYRHTATRWKKNQFTCRKAIIRILGKLKQ